MTIKIKENIRDMGFTNVSKTKHICIRGTETDQNLNSNIKIQNHEHYRNLRIDINKERRDSQEIKYKISQGVEGLKPLNPFWSKKISSKIKYIVYNFIFKSILLYGFKEWRQKEKNSGNKNGHLEFHAEYQKWNSIFKPNFDFYSSEKSSKNKISVASS